MLSFITLALPPFSPAATLLYFATPLLPCRHDTLLLPLMLPPCAAIAALIFQRRHRFAAGCWRILMPLAAATRRAVCHAPFAAIIF